MPKKLALFVGFTAAIGLLAFKLFAIGYPSSRLWGISQLAYFPSSFVFTFYAILLLIAVLLSTYHKSAFFRLSCDRTINQLSRIPRFAVLLICGAALLAIFIIFTDSTNLLGDGMLRLGEMENGTLSRAIHDYPTEPLDYLVHFFSYRGIFRPLNLEPVTCFRFWAYLAGLVYAFAAWRLASRLKKEGISIGFTLTYFLGWGGVMMFFGYAEDYALAAAATMIYFNFAIQYYDFRMNLWPLTISFIVTFFLHNLMIILLPSFVYLLWLKTDKKAKDARIAAMLSAVITLGWIAFSFSNKEGGAFLLFGSKSAPGYWLLGQAHLLDTVNELLLVSPAFAVLVWFQRRSTIADTRDHQLNKFFWISALAGFGALLFVDPNLGMARDWDMFALLLLAFHVALFTGADYTKIGRPLKNIAVIITIFFAFLWVINNSNETRSIARYKDITSLDKERSRYGYDCLGTYMMLRQRWQEALDAYSQSIKVYPHYRSYLAIANVYEQLGWDSLAIDNYQKTLILKPDEPRALYKLSGSEFQQGHYSLARDYLIRLSHSPVQEYDQNIEDMIKMLDQMIGDTSHALGHDSINFPLH